MIIENTDVYGIRHALRAMRNPLDSWSLSDSIIPKREDCIILGEKDKILSQKLTKAGTEHCKHLRMIQVWVDMTLPRYIYQEYDTYRFVEKVSCSTMHKIMSYTLNQNMFELPISIHTLDYLNELIELYKLESDPNKKKNIKRQLKNELPEGFLQKRTINTNYQQLLNIYKQRKNHELPEWHTICDWILGLTLFKELTGIEV